MPIPLLASLAIATAASIIAPRVGEKIGEWRAKRDLGEKTVKEYKSKNVQDVVKKTVESFRERTYGIDINRDGRKDLTVADLPGVKFVYRKQLSSDIQHNLVKQGMKPSKAEKIARTYEYIGGSKDVANVGGTLAQAVTAEIIAGKVALRSLARGVTSVASKGLQKAPGLVSSASKLLRGGGSTALQELKASLKGSAVGGAYEGAAQGAMQSVSDHSNWKEGLKNTALGAAIGAGISVPASGLLLGTKKLSTSAKSASVRRASGIIHAGLDWVGQTIIDPFEKPGDIIAGSILKRARGAGRAGASLARGLTGGKSSSVGVSSSATAQPSITSSNTPSQSQNTNRRGRTAPFKGPGGKGSDLSIPRRKRVGVFSRADARKGLLTLSPATSTPTSTPTPGGSTSVPSNTPDTSRTPTPNSGTPNETPNDNPNDTPNNEPTEEPNKSEEQTPEPTEPTPTITPTPTSTATPQARTFLPPPLPMLPVFRTGASIVGGSYRKKYVNELELFKGVTSAVFGFNTRPVRRASGKRKRG